MLNFHSGLAHESRLRAARHCLLPLYATLLGFIPAAGQADPFLTRDQNPLLAGFGLPLPAPAQTDGDSVTAVLNWSNTGIIRSSQRETLVVDNETREWRLLWQHALNDRWAMRLQVPYRTTSGGSLDDFLQDWHSTFGLPNGDRDALPRGRLHIRYVRDGRVLIDRTTDSSEFGDISLDTGYQWLKSERANVSGWFSLKTPTGSANTLNGSEAFDGTASVTANYLLGQRWTGYGQLSLTYLGRGRLLSDYHERWAYSGTAGLDVRTWGNLSLGLQFDAHSAVVEASRLKMLGDAVTLTFGGNYLTHSNWRFTLGITEDLLVGASPDVVFVFQVARLSKR